MNKLVKAVFTILLLLAFGSRGFCQRRMPPVFIREPRVIRRMYRMDQPPNPGRRILVVKENFIGQRLNLTLQQSRAFWPVYRQYEQELMTVRNLIRINNSPAAANGTEQIEKDMAYAQRLLEIRKQYKEEFLRILPPEKVSELYKSEREFNEEVLKQLSERRVRVGD